LWNVQPAVRESSKLLIIFQKSLYHSFGFSRTSVHLQLTGKFFGGRLRWSTCRRIKIVLQI